MGYKSIIFLLILAFIISFTHNWKLFFLYKIKLISHILTFVSELALFSAIIWVFVLLIQFLWQKRFKVVALLSIILILLITVPYYFTRAFSISIPAFTPNHFRTNIFTGKCECGGGSGQLIDDPWYFKPGCNNLDDKLRLAKEYGFFRNPKDLPGNKCDPYDPTTSLPLFGY